MSTVESSGKFSGLTHDLQLEVSSRWPSPCVDAFAYVLGRGSEHFRSWLAEGNLSPSDLTFAVEALVKSSSTSLICDYLSKLMAHDSVLVRESAVYAVQDVFCESTGRVDLSILTSLVSMSEVDPVPGLREAACSVINDLGDLDQVNYMEDLSRLSEDHVVDFLYNQILKMLRKGRHVEAASLLLSATGSGLSEHTLKRVVACCYLWSVDEGTPFEEVKQVEGRARSRGIFLLVGGEPSVESGILAWGNMPDNWDGQGSPSFSPSVISSALFILARLQKAPSELECTTHGTLLLVWGSSCVLEVGNTRVSGYLSLEGSPVEYIETETRSFDWESLSRKLSNYK